MTGAHSDTAGQEGFSILEMIVAMTILALVLGIASQAIVLAGRSISAAREQVEDARRLREMMADYEAGGQHSGGADNITSSGWTLKTSKIDVSRTKMTALIVEQGGAAGKRKGAFLTFLPETRPDGQ
ncbi:PulJ/GspJ family protein [Bradyrhizobium sp. Arg314]